MTYINIPESPAPKNFKQKLSSGCSAFLTITLSICLIAGWAYGVYMAGRVSDPKRFASRSEILAQYSAYTSMCVTNVSNDGFRWKIKSDLGSDPAPFDIASEAITGVRYEPTWDFSNVGRSYESEERPPSIIGLRKLGTCEISDQIGVANSVANVPTK
jgi:hypothetical protein